MDKEGVDVIERYSVDDKGLKNEKNRFMAAVKHAEDELHEIGRLDQPALGEMGEHGEVADIVALELEPRAPRRAHLAHEPDQKRQLVLVRRKKDRLADAVGRDLIRLDTHEFGLVHVFVSELHDALRQRGREQQVESLVGVRQATQ